MIIIHKKKSKERCNRSTRHRCQWIRFKGSFDGRLSSLLTALKSAQRVTRSQLACEATKIVLPALNERVFVSENLVCYRGEHDNFNLERLFFFTLLLCNQYFELLRCSSVHMSYVWLMRDAISGIAIESLEAKKEVYHLKLSFVLPESLFWSGKE